MIEIQNLTKFYGHNAAVKNISFNVNDNEILGFLGPNGAGKSSTMNVITGYLPSTSGRVLINGIDIAQEPKKAKKLIGYLPEIPPVYQDMKVREYLKFVAGIKDISKDKRASQIEDVMEKLKIKDMEKRLIRNLSKGYKQRVGFAQALLGNPPVLVLDEPTVGLDPKQVMEVRDLIRSLKKDHTIILSSHILQEIQAICDRVVIISHGEIKAIDTIKNLEESLGEGIMLNITVDGARDDVSAFIEKIPGVNKISDISYVKSNQYTYHVNIANDDVKKDVMSTLIKNDYEVSDVSSERPSLEEVFVKLTAQPLPKKTLDELLEEMDAADGEDADSTPGTTEEEDK